MNFFLGVDGGATKTKAVIGDNNGNILGKGEGPPSNYHLIGLEGAMGAIKLAVDAALLEASISINNIERAVFGLAGADLPAHFKELEKGLNNTFPNLSLRVVNDTCVALKGGSRKGWGVALVCGTGANACICTPLGKWFTLRGLGYETGLAGGAMNIIRDILHHAFRSHDGIGPKTKLEEEVLKSVNLNNYDEIAELVFGFFLFPNFTRPEFINLLNLLPMLFQLASEGDEISQDILIHHGKMLGEIAGWLIKKMGLEMEETEVVLVGGIYQGVNPLLIDQLTISLHQLAPRARIVFPFAEPVIGGYLVALEDSGIEKPAAYK